MENDPPSHPTGLGKIAQGARDLAKPLQDCTDSIDFDSEAKSQNAELSPNSETDRN
jgi:hypothetical protein